MSESTQKESNKGGRCWSLTPLLIDHIVSNVPNVYFVRPVALLSGVSESNLSRWLIRGEEEFNNNEDTLCSNLFMRFNAAKFSDSRDLVIKLKECPRNYGALTFILERCFRDEFEAKTEMQKKLEDLVFNKIEPLLGKGDISNGRQNEEDRAQDRQEIQ